MRVSVVITCYNYGRFLRPCIDSVLAQTYSDFDVVVVDDGSTDETEEVLRPLARHPGFSIHRQSNRGQASAKNKGIELSSGELIAFLDADDVWAPKKLELQVPLFSRRPIGVVYSGMDVIDQVGAHVVSEVPSGYWTYRRGRVTEWLGFDNFVPFSSSVVRRSILEAEGAFDETLSMGIDWDLWLRLSRVTDFDFVPDRLLHYRRGHAGQMSKNWDGRVAAADVIFQHFLARYPDVFSPSTLRRIRLYNACSRAAGYRHSDLKRSTAWLLRALRLAPWSPQPYVGLLRNMKAATMRHRRRA